MAQLIITAVGPDQPGLVGQLTGHVRDGGGNIVESRMVNLRGQFAVILLVEGEDPAIRKLRVSLVEAGEQMGLHVSTSEHAAPAQKVEGLPYRLKTYSLDQPGIMHAVTDVLRAHGVNIEDLQARQESAAFSGTPLFVMEMHLTVPANMSVKALRQELEKQCEKLNCDMDMEPA